MEKNQGGNMKESDCQKMLFNWASYFPNLKWMFAIPNGGSRNFIEAVHLKQQGVKSGVSDIFLPLPNKKYHGLFIELKVGKNKPTKNQIEFIDYANSVGYLAVVAYSTEEAIKIIDDYIDNSDNLENYNPIF